MTVAQDFRSGQTKLCRPEHRATGLKVILPLVRQALQIFQIHACPSRKCCLTWDSSTRSPPAWPQRSMSRPSSGNSHDLCCVHRLYTSHCQQLQLCPFKHFPCQLNNLSLLFRCCFCCFVQKKKLGGKWWMEAEVTGTSLTFKPIRQYMHPLALTELHRTLLATEENALLPKA